jgi:hypothetical protein
MNDDTDDDIFCIDAFRLDEELLRQARLFYEAMDALVEAKDKTLRTKAAFDLAEAELSLAIRKDPGSFGLEKATENSIGAAVIVNPKYRKAQEAYFDAKHEMDVCDVKVAALEQKKSMLESRVKLAGLESYASPRMPTREDKEHFDKLERDATLGKGKKRRDHV